MEGDNGTAVAGIVALGAVALLGVLFYILFVGQSQDMTHLHADIYALDEAANATPAAVPSPAPVSTPVTGPARPVLRPAPEVAPAIGVPVTTQLGGVAIPGVDTNQDPRLTKDAIELLLKDIVNGNGAGYAPLLEMILSHEDPSAVQGAISPLFNNNADVDALSALTNALRTGSPPPASSGLSTNLLVMYEMLVDSLASSSMMSDTTRGLLDTIKSKKCEIKFASDPDKLKTCLVVAMERPETAKAAAAVPVATPATPTETKGSKNFIRADGLITNVDGVEVTFEFSKRQLSSCDAGSCNATPLSEDPSRTFTSVVPPKAA